MSTKTLQFQFKIGSTLTDVTSVTLQDPTAAFGVRRTDTLEVLVAAGTALTHVSTGLYSYTFTEPEVGLDYEYWIEYVYSGNTKRIRQVLETGAGGGAIVVAPTTYAQMGLDTVACGDSDLLAFLTGQADLVWAMQARRGVALDLQYQYYVLDLCMLALDHVRMLTDTESGATAMTDATQMDASNTSAAHSETTRARSSSFTESSSSTQSFSRTAARSSSATASMTASNSASRNASSSDTSTMVQSSVGLASRTQEGSSLARGTVFDDDTSGMANASSAYSVVSKVKHEVTPFAFSVDPQIPEENLTSSFKTTSGNILGLVSASWMEGNSGVSHKVTPSTFGRINPSGGIDTDGASGDFSGQSSQSASHERQLVGSQLGSGSSSLTASGGRFNNRSGASSSAANSAMSGNSGSSMSSSTSETQARSATSASHSESSFNSSLVASSSVHSQMTGSGNMVASKSQARDYYSQIFDSLQQLWLDTQEAIKMLEAQMLVTSRYVTEKLAISTPQTQLVGQISLPTLPTMTQRPGVFSGVVAVSPFVRFIVR